MFIPPEDQVDLLNEDIRKLREVLKNIINSCVHPEIAQRALFVDLKIIRKVLKDTENHNENRV